MKIYNTLDRDHLRELTSEHKQPIKVYSCGPTVYSEPHIGNFKSMCFSDLLRNVIKHIMGLDIVHVMNITDVGHLVSDEDEGEDKMQKGARKEGMTAREVAAKYEARFKEAMVALRVDDFDVMPRATDHIQEQIDLVKSLEDKGYTYKLDDGIYFDTSKVADYGKLMGPNYKKHIEGLQSGARVEDSGKHNPTDFALWKFSPEGEKRDMERDSPWGKGFPGRHIECSAMSSKYLGNHFDIHVGGPEHIAVHHSNEIAQSECGLDFDHDHKNRVDCRVHHGVLTVDGGKMSKSLGNGYTLAQLADQGISHLDLRMFFFTAHYRSYQDFTWDGLRAVKTARLRLRKKILEAVKRLDFTATDIKTWNDLSQNNSSTYLVQIDQAFQEDMNLPQVLAIINTMAGGELTEDDLRILYFLEKTVLKLDLFEPIEEVSIDIPQEVTDLADQRLAAKSEKDYALADDLRNQISALGFDVKDTADGYELCQK